MAAPSESKLTTGPLVSSTLSKSFDLKYGNHKHRELQAFIYLLANDYSIKYSNGYFRREFGEPDDSNLCYNLIRGRKTPCDPCPAQIAIQQRTEQVWIWEDYMRGKLYEVHEYPYLSDDGDAMALGLGIVIKEERKERKSDSNPRCFRDFLSICCHCKNINNDQGEWQGIETYFKKKYEILFSHGICPECLKKYYPTALQADQK